MTPEKDESLDELSAWYKQVYIPQLGNGSNVNPKVTTWNLAIMKDAIASYRTWRETEAMTDTETDPEFFARPSELQRSIVAEVNALEAARGPVHIDARRFYESGRTETPRFFRCGNCGVKLPFSGDAERDHHTAQAHSVEDCGKRIEAAMDHRALLAEMRERNEQPLQIAAKKPWWKIW